jgi:hypothetical protein
MRVFLAFICALMVVALVGYSRPALAADTMLTGQMATMNALTGAPWSCSTSVPAMMGQPAHTDQATVTFGVVPGNVIHDHVSGAPYVGDDYYGYSSKMSTHWSTSADNMGGHGFATSPDGKTYTGTSSMGPATMNVTSTYTIVGPNQATVHEVLSGNGVNASIDTTCSR